MLLCLHNPEHGNDSVHSALETALSAGVTPLTGTTLRGFVKRGQLLPSARRLSKAGPCPRQNGAWDSVFITSVRTLHVEGHVKEAFLLIHEWLQGGLFFKIKDGI